MRKTIKILSLLLLVALMVGNVWAADTVNLKLFFYKQEIVKQMGDLVDAFAKTNPNVKIELEIVPNDSMTVLKTRMQSGQAPDIIQLQSYASVFEFAEAGWLADLSKEPVMGKVVPSTKSAVTFKGKQYALPMDVAGIGIIYNKEIFEKYGLKPPTTFAQLQKVCTVLKKHGVTPFASMFRANWSIGHFLSMAHTTLAGEKLMPWMEKMNKGQASWGDPVNKKQLFRILDFYKANSDKKAAEFDWNEQQAAFAGGKAAMMVQGLWSYGAAISTNPHLRCGFIPFPCTNSVKNTKLFADVDSTFALSATASPEKLKAAKAFINWLSTPEAVKIWVEKCHLVPTFKGADVKSMDAPFQDLVKYLNAGKTNPWAFSMYPVNAWEDATKNGAQAYIFGTQNADQVIQYIDQVWKREISK
ncbi:MAG TPA: extracellular solute-binding protein [Bacillota bacterium]|nr:extracellular solute-binding protein [Bacillota bacterium]